MVKTKQKLAGFTLAEILIVIALMAILAMAALMSSYKTQRYFAFLNTYKEVFNNLRSPRSYTVTNKMVAFSGVEKNPAAYSVEIKLDNLSNPTKYTVTVFGDNPEEGTINSYDDTQDTIIGIPYEIPSDRFAIDVCTSNGNISCDTLHLTALTVSYVPNKMKILRSINVALPASAPSTDQFIILRLKDKYYDIGKYIVIFTKSGIVESMDPTQYTITNPSPTP